FDEGLERAAVCLRRQLFQLVEIGPDLAAGAGRDERVAAAAAVGLEDCEPGRPGLPAARLDPLLERRSRLDLDTAPHQRMTETAELGADHRERARARRRDDDRVHLPGE